jgi:pyocin large subunit-like protein
VRHIGLALAGLLLAVAVAVLVPRPTHHAPPPAIPLQAADSAAAASPAARHPEIGFRSRERLIEHFRKHGREFEAADAAAYLALAQALRDRPAGGDVIEAVRRDGVVTRFDRGSGAFIAFDRDLTIRTFFRPNDGEAYFRRQLGREH